MTDVNGDFLAPAGLHLVNVGARDADTGEDVRRRLADSEAHGKDWISSLYRYFAGLGHIAAATAHYFFKTWIHQSVIVLVITC